MTASFRDRIRFRQPPGADGTTTEGTLAQRVVAHASGLLSRGESRRGFLAKSAVVGSAMAVNPLGYILKPGTAYAALCGTCSDGWTAFCCTVNNGRNECPPGSFVAGWWKADNAAFCCGKARYIIDCNATCPTQCSCRCSGASCDGRRTCCNQFRYGQCHQEIACYGPVVCRVATCVPPWQYDASCTTSSATDNRTVTHGAPCLPDECASAISKLYQQLGGASGVLGPVTTSERSTADGTGRYAHYRNGSIFQRDGQAPYEVHGAIATVFKNMDYHRGQLKYPTSNRTSLNDTAGGVYNRFENGIVYSAPATGTYAVYGGLRTLHSSTGGVRGPLGYPVSRALAGGGGIDLHQYFQGGTIWFTFATGAHYLMGSILGRYKQLGGPESALGYPTSDAARKGDGTLARFQHGTIYSRKGVGTFALTGVIEDKYRSSTCGEVAGPLGWPIGETHPNAGGQIARFQTGTLAYRPGKQVREVHGSIDQKWRTKGGPASELGWPTTDTTTLPDGAGRRSGFDRGAVYTQRGVGTWEVHGPIYTRYRQLGETTSPLGYPRSDVFADGSVFRCTFQHGTLTYNPGTGTVSQT